MPLIDNAIANIKRLARTVFLVWLLLPLGAMAQTPDVPISLETTTGSIKGSLTLPLVDKKGPVVLIIAGSGPTDRNGNSRLLPGNNNNLKMLSEALASVGVASVRYDKRGLGDSVQTPERELVFDNLVQDAAGWVGMLKRDARFTGVIVVGHSEGSLIGMLASRQASANAFVSIAGPAQGASSLLRQQLAGKLPAALADRNEAILRSLEHAEFVDDIPAPLNSLYRKSAQPYLISWFKYVPADEFSQLKIPTLVLQGDTDIQVGVDQARALKLALPQAELAIIHGMNHVLKQVPPDSDRKLSSYSDPNLPLSPELVQQLLRFVTSPVLAKTPDGGK